MKIKVRARHFCWIVGMIFVISAMFMKDNAQASDTALIIGIIFHCAYIILGEVNKEFKKLNERFTKNEESNNRVNSN